MFPIVLVQYISTLITTYDMYFRNQVPAGEWRGALHQFVTGKPSNVDLISYMQRGVDLRPSAVKKWWGSIKTEAAVNDQMYDLCVCVCVCVCVLEQHYYN